MRGAAQGQARQAPPGDSARPPPLPQCATGPAPAPGQWRGGGRTPPQPAPIPARRWALGPPSCLPSQLALPPPSRGRKANAIALSQNGGRTAPACGTDSAVARTKRNGAATTPAGGQQASRAQSTSAPRRCASPALRSAEKPPELLRTWAEGLGAGRAGRLRGAVRQAVGQMRPSLATDGSDCCATLERHREMEAAPRVSAVPRGDWRRRRPRPSPGNPGQGGGAAPAPSGGSHVGAAAGINNPCREGCVRGGTQPSGLFTRPVLNRLKPVLLLRAGKGFRQAFLPPDEQRMRGKYVRRSWST